MSTVEVKEKLHSFVDKASDEQVIRLLNYCEESLELSDELYDQETIAYLHNLNRDVKLGLEKTLTLSQFTERIDSSLERNGV